MGEKHIIYELNLAKKPFVNIMVPVILSIIIGIVIVAFTVFNTRVILSAESDVQGYSEEISRIRQQKDRLRNQINVKDSELSKVEFGKVSRNIEYANDLIDRRILSWTRLFDRLENLTPEELKMKKISPSVRKGRIDINFRVEVPSQEIALKFIDALEESPYFDEVRLRSQSESSDDGQAWDLAVNYFNEK